MTEPTQERPLVTFALFAYNQERFIREAVEGALAQTYSPLQVIMSDDYSSDRTFKIIQEMVANYSGPHEILLNRNERNFGIGGHVNRVMELANGEFIVVAAGDDISLPERTFQIYQYWESLGRKECSIYSAYYEMGSAGRLNLKNRQHPLPNYVGDITRMLEQECPGVHGATHGWHRALFSKFGPLPNEVITEDRTIAARAILCDGIYYMQEPLILYRRLEESLGRTMMQNRDYYLRLHTAIWKSMENDCRKVGWGKHKLYQLQTRFITNYELTWKMKNEKLRSIPYFFISLITGKMRLVTGFELLQTHFPYFLRYIYKNLKKI